MMTQSGDITVSKKTLLHISEGIYRSEGSALKELINNAFDANATKVIINTNYPLFDIISCRDNGFGMSKEEFLRIVQGGIGDSLKATNKEQKEGRPIIGRLGIGILAIAQICRSFTIISHHRESKTAFKGRMIFNTDVTEAAKKQFDLDEKSSYEVGTWQVGEDVSFDDSKAGVFIFSDDLRQGFIRNLKSNSEPKNNSPLNHENLMDVFYAQKVRTIRNLGHYYEFLWELSHLTPIPYSLGSVVNDEVVNKIEYIAHKSSKGLSFKTAREFVEYKNKELAGYDFSVIVDDIKLTRPIELPSPLKNNEGEFQECQMFYFEYENIVKKKPLAFSGYIFAQEKALFPRDLTGVQVRIKNVGIGLYDNSLLKYDKIESPRDNWVTGEIYVTKGLESALNIDRDSFNENDEHFYVLKTYFHDILSKTVFPTIRSRQSKRNKLKKERELLGKSEELRTIIESVFLRYLPDGFIVEFTSKKTDLFEFRKHEMKIIIPELMISASPTKKKKFFVNNAFNIFQFFSNELKNESDLQNCIKDISETIIG